MRTTEGPCNVCGEDAGARIHDAHHSFEPIPAKDKTNPTYQEAIYCARLLIEPGENPEYERGQAELIADLWGKDGVFLSDRTEEVVRDILAVDIYKPANAS